MRSHGRLNVPPLSFFQQLALQLRLRDSGVVRPLVSGHFARQEAPCRIAHRATLRIWQRFRSQRGATWVESHRHRQDSSFILFPLWK